MLKAATPPGSASTIEGDATFEGQQRFLETTALLAKERRLSRAAILARKC